MPIQVPKTNKCVLILYTYIFQSKFTNSLYTRESISTVKPAMKIFEWWFYVNLKTVPLVALMSRFAITIPTSLLDVPSLMRTEWSPGDFVEKCISSVSYYSQRTT